MPLGKNSFFSKLRGAINLHRLKILKEIDIISFHGSLPLFIFTKFLHKPYVYTYYGTQFDAYLEKFFGKKAGYKNLFINWLTNQFIYIFQAVPVWSSPHIVGISKYCVNEIRQLYRVKSKHVYLGTFTDGVNKTKSKTRKTLRFISISRFTPYKGFHHLINIVHKLRVASKINIGLTLIGSSHYFNYLNLLKSYKYPWLKIYETIQEPLRIKLLNESHIYLNYDRYLFFGLPLIEAAACSVPTVTRDFCAACEIVIRKKTGLVAKNEDEFYDCVKTLSENKYLLKTLSQNANLRAKTIFDWKLSARKYYQLLFQIYTNQINLRTYISNPILSL